MEVFILLVCTLVLVFFLGDIAGRESHDRTRVQREIIEQKAKLDSLETRYYAEFTPAWLYILAIVIAAIGLACMCGTCHGHGDYYYHHY